MLFVLMVYSSSQGDKEIEWSTLNFLIIGFLMNLLSVFLNIFSSEFLLLRGEEEKESWDLWWLIFD